MTRPSPALAGIRLKWWTGCWLFTALATMGDELPAPLHRFTVHANGTVVRPSRDPGAARQTGASRPEVRYTFGLPAEPPARRWREDPAWPVCHTTWEKNGIRYTQVVLLTRPGSGDLMPAGQPAPDSVLLVHLIGENTASEYTEATATFAVQTGGQFLDLELRAGRVYAGPAGDQTLLAIVDVAGEGVAGPRGKELRFRGDMPPGTSGFMTLKIPVGRLEGEPAINAMLDLMFDEQLPRVRRFWTDHAKAGTAPAVPVAFAEDTP